MSNPLRRNIEIKARCANLDTVRQAVHELCGDTAALENQCDTYFHVPQGRLKLREIEGAPAVLIGYARPDDTAARLSHYRLVPVSDAEGLKATLAGALGIRGEVSKRREIYFWRNVRIHLDVVAGLGTFVELEAVLSSADDAAAAPACLAELCDRLGLHSDQFLAPSYSDLLGL